MTVCINGKFLAQGLTGTQRYAAEIVRVLVSDDSKKFTLIVPRDGVIPDWAKEVEVHRSRFRGILFEQLALPFLTRHRLLVSLAGPAPLLKRKQLVAMHDSSVADLPDTYSWSFVLWYRFLYKALSKTAMQIVTVSEFSRTRLSEMLSSDPSRFAIVPNGSDHMQTFIPRRPSMEIDLHQPFALCVGTLARHKNLAPVVNALSKKGINVVVVGASGNSRVFGEGNPLEDQLVHVLGRIDDDELRWLYENATALVFPSLFEGFGLPIVEAQSCGCPVISSDAASMPEVGGDAALYFSAKHPAVAVALFEKLANDEVFRKEVVGRGYDNAKRFTWENSADALVLLLQKALTGR